MSAVLLTGAGIDGAAVSAVAREGRVVEIAASVMTRLREGRAVLDRAAGSGQAIYGLNTGLGANLGTSITGDAGAFQRQLLEGRSGAVGDPLPADIVRATMFARAAMLSVGGSGISPDILPRSSQRSNAGVHPVMPSLGSIGAGDLVLMTALGRLLIGEGDAEYRGQRLAGQRCTGHGGACPGPACAQGRAVADQRLCRLGRPRGAHRRPTRWRHSASSSRPAR